MKGRHYKAAGRLWERYVKLSNSWYERNPAKRHLGYEHFGSGVSGVYWQPAREFTRYLRQLQRTMRWFEEHIFDE